MIAVADFDWDEGNRGKCQRHGVSIDEIESVFSGPIVILPDLVHSGAEERKRAIGRSRAGRHVFVAFTIREKGGASLIRPISARYMHRKEVRTFEKENPDVQI